MHSSTYYNDDYFVCKLLQIDVDNIKDPAEKFNVLLDTYTKYQTLRAKVEHYKKLYEDQVECTAKLLTSCNDKQTTIKQQRNEILELTNKFMERTNDLAEYYTQKVNDLAEDYTQNVNDLAEDYKNKLNDTESEYNEKLDTMRTEYEQKLRERDNEITKLHSAVITMLCKLTDPEHTQRDYKCTQENHKCKLIDPEHTQKNYECTQENHKCKLTDPDYTPNTMTIGSIKQRGILKKRVPF